MPRSIYEGARDIARDIAKTEAYQTSRYQRETVKMLPSAVIVHADWHR
jgi:hypothetical protein